MVSLGNAKGRRATPRNDCTASERGQSTRAAVGPAGIQGAARTYPCRLAIRQSASVLRQIKCRAPIAPPACLQHDDGMIEIRQHGLADRHQPARPRHRLHVLRAAGPRGTATPGNYGRGVRAPRSLRPRTRWGTPAACCSTGTNASISRSSAASASSCASVRAWAISNSPLASLPQLRAGARRSPAPAPDRARCERM